MKILRKIQKDVEELFGYHTGKNIEDYLSFPSNTRFSGHRNRKAEIDIRPVIWGLRDAPIFRLSRETKRKLELGYLPKETLLILIEETTHWCDQNVCIRQSGLNYSHTEKVGEELLADFARQIIGETYEIKDFLKEEQIKGPDEKVYEEADRIYKRLAHSLKDLSDKQIMIKLRTLAHKHGKSRLDYAKKIIESSKN